MDSSTIALAGIAVSISVAAAGWVVAYLSKRQLDSRLAQLERVNKQLRELYGPLYIGLEAANRTWAAFWEKHRPAHGRNYYFGPDAEVSEDEKKVWRNWIENVFEPMNARAEEILTNNIDLFDSEDIPDAFIDALAHVASYRAVLAQWKESDFSEHVAVNNWPRKELIAIVKPAYEKLRKRQLDLLNA
jgi:hypothetical protein